MNGERQALPHRADIDGLRAVAVVPVVLYHADVGALSGGFVGVDVFFVISGFLITSLILRETAAGTFSYTGFLERRARRLVPAAVPVIAFVLIAGWFLLTPDHYVELGRSIVYFCLFAANHYFLGETDYFAASVPSPLLHTWSLSVEEQFYLVYSAALLAILRYRPGLLRPVLCAAMLVSFAYAATLLQEGSRNEAFYLTAARFWELLAGAMLAIFPQPRLAAPMAASIRAAGLAMIAIAVFGFDETTLFPGASALLPVAGAVLVMLAGASATTDPLGKLLCSSAVTYVGRLSYALYLWHWPLLVFAGIASTQLPDWYRWPVVGLAVVLAALSYHAVETPWRRRRVMPSARAMLTGTVSVGALAITAGGLIDVARGVPWRLPEAARKALAFTSPYADGMDRRCLYTTLEDQASPCRLGADAAEPDFILWGDSHAFSAWPAFDRLAREHGRSGILATWPSCAPMVGYDRAGQQTGECADNNAAALRLIGETGIRNIVLAARWVAYSENPLLLPRADRPQPPEDLLSALPDADSTSRASFRELLAANVALHHRAGRKVWLIGTIPTYPFNVPNAIVGAIMSRGDLGAIGRFRTQIERQNHYSDSVMRALQTRGLADHAALDGIFCPRTRCVVVDGDGVSLYFDEQHLTGEGAWLMRPVLEPIFDAMSAGR